MASAFGFIILPLWVICILAETHRAPFDFAEAESELVSGFNTEYSGAYFAFVFLSEYAVLLFRRALLVYLFVGNLSILVFVIGTLLFSFIFI